MYLPYEVDFAAHGCRERIRCNGETWLIAEYQAVSGFFGDGCGCWTDEGQAEDSYGPFGIDLGMQMYLSFEAGYLDRGCRSWIRCTGVMNLATRMRAASRRGTRPPEHGGANPLMQLHLAMSKCTYGKSRSGRNGGSRGHASGKNLRRSTGISGQPGASRAWQADVAGHGRSGRALGETWRQLGVSEAELNRLGSEHVGRQQWQGSNLLEECRDAGGSCVGQGAQDNFGVGRNQIGDGAAKRKVVSSCPSVDGKNLVNDGASGTHSRRSRYEDAGPPRIAAGSNMFDDGAPFEHRMCSRKCVEAVPGTRFSDFVCYDVACYFMDWHGGDDRGTTEAASSSSPCHDYSLRISWCRGEAVSTEGDKCSHPRTRPPHATSRSLTSRRGNHRRHAGRTRCSDAYGWSAFHADIDHHHILTRPNRDDRDRVGNFCTLASRSVDGTRWTDRTGPLPPSVPFPLVPLSITVWRQDSHPTTCDPTTCGGEEAVHGARRKRGAPSQLINCRITSLSLEEEEAEGQGGQEDSTATDITIRDGDVCCAGGDGDGSWGSNGSGDDSDDVGGGDIGRDDDDDGSNERHPPSPSSCSLSCGPCARARARGGEGTNTGYSDAGKEANDIPAASATSEWQ